MGKAFIAAQKRWFPKAKLCIDRFHVVKEVTGASDKARARIVEMKEPDVNAKGEVVMAAKFSADEKRKLKKARNLLRMRRGSLEQIDFDYATGLAERRHRIVKQMPDIDKATLESLLPKPKAPKCGVVDALLEWDIELKVAYGLLQAFYEWDAMPWCAEKRDGLEEWCKLAAASPLPEFKTAARTFRAHRTGILNGYKYGKTNATAEGLNNTIKLLKKNAYGFRDFEHMRRRCLITLGYYKLIHGSVHLPDVEG
jgi:transposase